MSNKTYFGPGPSQLYPGVDTFIADALQQDVCSISHRSAEYVAIHKKTVTELRKLINLPDNYQVFFVGSASESWERLFNNCVIKSSHHFVNGAFSKKFYQYGQAINKEASITESPMGVGFDMDKAEIPSDIELISFTKNETSGGTAIPLEDIYTTREKFPEALISVDVVSTLPYPNLDFSKIDSAYFSVQKCFGMPAGLGVWLVNNRCIEKSEKVKEALGTIGSHHTIPELLGKATSFQTPSTPNVLGIYTLGRVAEAMNNKTAEVLRKETDIKAKLLNNYISESTFLDYGVENVAHRSPTVIVANTTIPASELNKQLAKFDMEIGAGYGKNKTTQIRIANFPAHSIEVVEKLISAFKEIEG